MAMSKSSKPKRSTVRKSVRKYLSRKKKSQAKSNLDTKFIRVEVTGTLVPSQGITVSNYVSFFPTLLDVGNGQSPISVQSNPMFKMYSYMYDRVRVNRMKITVTPKANVLSQAEAQEDNQFNTSGDGLVHHVVDKNSKPPANIQALQYYPSYRKIGVMKTWSRKYSIKYPVNTWIDIQKGQLDFSDTSYLQKIGAFGGIYIYAENLLEDAGELYNEPWATVKIEYDCVFQGQSFNNVSFTYDDDGNETGVSIQPYANAIVPDTTVVPLYGTLNPKTIDNSGNVVNRGLDVAP